MINMAFMPLYIWEMWDVTPVTHERTHEQWKVGQYSVWAESAKIVASDQGPRLVIWSQQQLQSCSLDRIASVWQWCGAIDKLSIKGGQILSDLGLDLKLRLDEYFCEINSRCSTDGQGSKLQGDVCRLNGNLHYCPSLHKQEHHHHHNHLHPPRLIITILWS